MQRPLWRGGERDALRAFAKLVCEEEEGLRAKVLRDINVACWGEDEGAATATSCIGSRLSAMRASLMMWEASRRGKS